MTLDYMFAWVMVMLRSIGLVIQLPVIAGRPIPIAIRIALSIGIALLLAGNVPHTTVPIGLWHILGASALEVVLGLAMGFVVQMSFGAIEMAGRLISTEIGMSASPGLGVPEPSHEPVAALMSAMAVVLFFLLGGHYGVLLAFAKSFQIAPAGAAGFDPAAASSLIRGTSYLIELGFRIAAPFIAMNFLINLAFSVLGRAVPKMNVFIVSFSARAVVGLGLFSTAGALIARYLYVEFGDLPLRLLKLLRAG